MSDDDDPVTDPDSATPSDDTHQTSPLTSFGFSPLFLLGVLVVLAAAVAFWLSGGSDGDNIAVDTAGEVVDEDDTDNGSSPSTSYAFGFPTPTFEWSGVPTATTELMITIQEVDSGQKAAVLASTDLDADGWPVGGLRWSASGISPGLSSQPESSFTSGSAPDAALLMSLPEGVVERKTGSAIVTIDDVPFDNKFIGPNRDGQVFLFTIYALCEPSVGDPLAYRPAWGRRNAVDLAWFAASADGL